MVIFGVEKSPSRVFFETESARGSRFGGTAEWKLEMIIERAIIVCVLRFAMHFEPKVIPLSPARTRAPFKYFQARGKVKSIKKYGLYEFLRSDTLYILKKKNKKNEEQYS